MTYENLTIMYSLPRSMTQWWRWFFSRGCHALHDPLARCSHPSMLRKIVESANGERMFIADTSAIYFHDRFQVLLPGHRRLYMMRGLSEIDASIRKQGGVAGAALLRPNQSLLRHAWAADAGDRLHYGELEPARVGRLFHEVTGRPPLTPGAVVAALACRIDTPLRLQYRNPEHVKSLLSYKDQPCNASAASSTP